MRSFRTSIFCFPILTPLLIAGALTSARADELSIGRCRELARRLAARAPEVIAITFDQLETREYLPQLLKVASRTKAKVLWNPVFRKGVQRSAFNFDKPRKITSTGNFLNGYVKPGTSYTFILTNRGMLLAPETGNGINNYLSKHLFLGKSRPQRFAGRLQRLEDETWVLDNGSGSYAPGDALMPRVKDFFERGLGLDNVVAHSYKSGLYKAATRGPSRKVEAVLSRYLSHWVEQSGRAPSPASIDRNERMAYMIWRVSRGLPEVRARTSQAAQEILSGSRPGDAAVPYATLPLRLAFEGEEHGKSIFSEQKQQEIRFEVKYLRDPAERREHLLRIDDGKLVDSQGRPIDSKYAALDGRPDEDQSGRIMIGMGEHGDLLFSRTQEIGKFHHSSLHAGGPSAFPGEAVVDQGVPRKLKNRSGHYEPPAIFFAQILDRFQESGVDISKIELELFEPGQDRANLLE